MLNKNEIIKELKNEEFMVRNAIYEYVCNLHLYDDNQINEALIEFIKNNYKEINMSNLRFSKLNNQIVQCLIDIRLNEEKDFIKESIDKVLVNHYNLIKDLDYEFEKIIIDEGDLLLYKKIKHFAKKDAGDLIGLYISNISNYYMEDKDTIVTEIIRMAIGIALTQTESGEGELLKYVIKLLKSVDNGERTLNDLLKIDMLYLVYPLCSSEIEEFDWLILELYIQNMEFIAYSEECNYYFSNICDDEFVESYIKRLKEIKKTDKEPYYYDIAQFLNSNKMDEYLLEELKRNNDDEIKENIIRILASKFDKRTIPYGIDFAKKYNYAEEEDFKLELAPLLILEGKEDEVSKEIIREAKEGGLFDEDEEEIEMYAEMLKSFQEFMLKDKDHIKEYKKVRKLHQQITDDMMDYYNSGKFIVQSSAIEDKNISSNMKFQDVEFDSSTKIGAQSLANIIIYKNSPDISCITEDFIKNKKYKKEEKNKMLDSMLNSEMGLFEIIKTDRLEGQVYFKNIFNNKTYCVTDIAFSSNLTNENVYVYTRIVSYNNICFGTGFVIPFDKEDEFIKKWIKENRKKENNQDFRQFMELYTAYTKGNDQVPLTINKIK